MPLAELALASINERALRDLIEGQVPEGALHDYKEAVTVSSDSEKKEFLKDVSAFANSQGGHLIIGMRESGGLPKDLMPVTGDLDELALKIEAMLRDSIQPRIIGIALTRVPLTAGGEAMVVRVPQSWNGPHRVSFQGVNRYYLRNSAGVHEASVDELRSLFMKSRTNLENITDWASERIKLVRRGAGPIRQLYDLSNLFIHMSPQEYDPAHQVDLPRAISLNKFGPMNAEGWRTDYNQDGVIFTRPNASNGYTQIFRNGQLEAVYSGIAVHHGGRYIHANSVYQMVLRGTVEYVPALLAIGARAPLICSVTLAGVENLRVLILEESNQNSIYSDSLSLPTAYIIGADRTQIKDAFKLTFNALWNAGGERNCPHYD